MLETRLGADVIYTRDDDTFIPLETRTAIANEHQADLFISVHANSSPDPSARGVETYYLNFTSNPDSAWKLPPGRTQFRKSRSSNCRTW